MNYTNYSYQTTEINLTRQIQIKADNRINFQTN